MFFIIFFRDFAKISIESPGSIKYLNDSYNPNSVSLGYPCTNQHECAPYEVKLKPGIYQFECWGSKGSEWKDTEKRLISKPGLGGYTYGRITIHKPTTFYIYIGNIGFFNAMNGTILNITAHNGLLPGGATDVRLRKTDNWYDLSGLITRIMVAGGGGGAEWAGSVGGNGGGLVGGSSISGKDPKNEEVHDEECPGGNQTDGSECTPFYYEGGYHTFGNATKGTFGSAGNPKPYIANNSAFVDYGGFGGGGYYGGTSYSIAFSGSGGSSYISGYPDCDSVKNNSETVEHIGQPDHFSGYVFQDPEMIQGNTTMPVPFNLGSKQIYNGTGAFRVTLISLTKKTSVMMNLKLSKFVISSLHFVIMIS